SGAPALGEGLPGPQGRVAVDGPQVVGDVLVGEVLELVAQPSHAAAHLHRLVDERALPAAAAAVPQPELRVRVPVGAADPPPEVARHPGDAVAGVGEAGRAPALDLLAQPGADALVGVDREQPVVAGRL